MVQTLSKELFGQVVRRRDEEIDLASAALLVAQMEYPNLDIKSYLGKLNSMGRKLRRRIGSEKDPEMVIFITNAYLFKEEGFRGDYENSYDTRNSFLNDVLDRKLGIPITLSMLYMELGRRVGLPVAGVDLPGRFIVKYCCPGGDVFLDPFNKGALLTEEECARFVREALGPPVRFQKYSLASLTKRQILTRMLSNLKGIYVNAQSYRKALEVVERILLISPWSLDEIKERGMIHYHLRNYNKSLSDLETYLKFSPNAKDADLIRQDVRWLRQLVEASK